MKNSAATMASRSVWFPREAAVQERHRTEAEDKGGMLATWDTRCAGLRPWYPGISPGNFGIT